MNDELCPWDKPRRTTYLRHRKHKSVCLTNYSLYDYHFGTDPKNKAYTHFNFKKTNAKKYKYSCWGYGGTCYSCGFSSFKCFKNRTKYTVESTESGCNNFSMFLVKPGIVVK